MCIPFEAIKCPVSRTARANTTAHVVTKKRGGGVAVYILKRPRYPSNWSIIIKLHMTHMTQHCSSSRSQFP